MAEARKARMESKYTTRQIELIKEFRRAVSSKQVKVIYDVKMIMKRAWACVKKHGMTMSDAMKWSWEIAKKEAQKSLVWATDNEALKFMEA